MHYRPSLSYEEPARRAIDETEKALHTYMPLWNRACDMGGGLMYDPIDTLESIESQLIVLNNTLDDIYTMLERLIGKD